MNLASTAAKPVRPLEVALVALHVRQGESGSNEPYVTGLLSGLASIDSDVARFRVYAAKWLDAWPAHGAGTPFVFHRVPVRGGRYLSYGVRLLQEWRVAMTRERADVLLFTGTSAAPTARHPQVAVVHWDNRLQPRSAPPVRHLANSAMMRIIRARCARVVVPTASYAEFLVRAWGFDCEQPAAIHHGVRAADTARRSPTRKAGAIAVLNDLPHKNLDVLLRAWALFLADADMPMSLTLVGAVSAESLDRVDVPWRDWEASGALVRIPRLEHADVLRVMASSEFLVSPSEGETFCMPLAEAMAVGTPVVAADTSVAREVCGDAAVYAASRDAGALAETIRRVHGDPVLQTQMADTGLQRVATLTWENAAEQLVSLLLEVCGPPTAEHGPGPAPPPAASSAESERSEAPDG